MKKRIFLIAMMLICALTVMTACNDVHTHKYSDKWTNDETYHWHKCEGCEEITGKAAHNYGDDDICDDCKYKRGSSVTPPEHKHNFSSEWTNDGTSHWHKCEGCEEITGKAAHNYGDDDICDDCGYKRGSSVTPGEHKHNFSSEWTNDETYHWHKCESCEEESNVAFHNYGDDNKCDDCGYEKDGRQILILEGFEDDGESLETSLEEVNGIINEVKRVNINPKDGKFDELPNNAIEMRKNFEQIILVNVANSDLTSEKMPKNFDEELKAYVEDYGGGLFVVGGNEDYFDESGHPVPHAFNVTDMENAGAYAELLPVTVETYKPPVALVMLVDASTSMATLDGDMTIMDHCKRGVTALLEDGLTYRDFVSVVKFGRSAQTIFPLTSVKNKAPIFSAIDDLNADEDDTKFEPAIREAIRILKTKGKDEVAKWHIILISDGISNEDYDEYGSLIRSESNTDTPITLSVAHLSTNAEATTNMKNLCNDGNGTYYAITTGHAREIGNIMRAELKSPNVSDFIFEEESIKVEETYYNNSILDGIDKGSDVNNPYERLPKVKGFFATREKTAQRGKPQPEKILQAGYVPLYVQWQYGNGRVGAYMSSLSNGEIDGFSGNRFFGDVDGERLIENIVNSLMPQYNIVRNGDFIFYTDEQDGSINLINYTGNETHVKLPYSFHGKDYKIYKNAFKGKSIISIEIPNGVRSIGDRAFYDCDNLQKVYFHGTAKEWDEMEIEFYYNGILTSATRYYYSANDPKLSDDYNAENNYYHYNDDGEIVVWEK